MSEKKKVTRAEILKRFEELGIRTRRWWIERTLIGALRVIRALTQRRLCIWVNQAIHISLDALKLLLRLGNATHQEAIILLQFSDRPVLSENCNKIIAS